MFCEVFNICLKRDLSFTILEYSEHHEVDNKKVDSS